MVRTKTPNVAGNPRVVEANEIQRLAANPMNLERFQSLFANREVILGRVLDIAFLESTRFPYLEHFRVFGWLDFILLHRDIYIDAVRMCYSNASNAYHRNNFDDRFKSRVCGKSFEINRSLIHNLFGIPEGGLLYESWSFNVVEATQVVFEDESLTHFIDSTSHLSMMHRLLHLICVHILVPRKGNFSSVTKEDLWLMYNIITRQRVDLCAIIVHEMIGVFSRKNRSLPYAMAISLILENKIDNLGNVRSVSIHKSQHINRGSLIRMGYKEDKEGHWAKSKKRKEVSDSSDEDEAPIPPSSFDIPSPTSPGPSQIPSSSHQFEDIQALIHGMADLKSEVVALRDR